MLQARAYLTLALFGALCSPAVGCNSLTGADDLELARAKKHHHSSTGAGGDGSGGGATGPTSGAGAGSAVATTGTGVPAEQVDAMGVQITQISVYQTIRRPLMEGGAAASSPIPVVAGKDALVRISYALDGGYTGVPVTAYLYVGEGSAPLQVTTPLGGASTDDNLASTINLQVPGALLFPGVTYRVELKQDPVGSVFENAAARYPAAGFEAMNVASSGSSLKVMLVPIAYGADGSNRLPDTSSTQQDRYRNLFYAMYPVPNVEITVRSAVGWDQSVDPDGTGWTELLDAVGYLREQDNAPPDVYYMGVFNPAASFGNYCFNSCIAGLGNIGGPSDVWSRAAIGLGYSGPEAAETAVHEIGHTHGRKHAPCGGPLSVDANYPYAGGDIGVWGYSLVTGKLYSPNNTADMMGYCLPMWISDYTYDALFQRIKTVNNAAMIFPPETLNRVYERVRVDGHGHGSWLGPMQLRTPPMAEATTVTLWQGGTKTDVTGQYYPYDHLDGGVVMWPKPASRYDAVDLEVAGKVVSLTP